MMQNDKKHHQEESSLLSIKIIKSSDFPCWKVLLVSFIKLYEHLLRVYFSHFFLEIW